MNAIYKAMLFAIVFSQKSYTSSNRTDSNSLGESNRGMLEVFERELWSNELPKDRAVAATLNRQNVRNQQREEKEQVFFDCDDCKALVRTFGIGCFGCIPCVLCIIEFFKR